MNPEPTEMPVKFYPATDCAPTLRDQFAMAAIGPLMGSDGFEKTILSGGFSLRDVPRFSAELAYQIADAMLTARKQKGQQ